MKAAILRWLLGAALLAGLIVFYALGLHHSFSWQYVRDNLQRIQETVAENLLLAVAGYFALYVIVTGLSLPIANILSLLAGALFGRWIGTVLVLVAATTGATIAMLGSRFLFRDAIRRWLNAGLGKFDEGIRREGAYYLLSLRLIPIVPFWLVNLGMGLTELPAGLFFVVSLIGMAPAAFIYVNAGTAFASIESPADIASPTILVSFALLGVAPLVLRRLIRKRPTPAEAP